MASMAVPTFQDSWIGWEGEDVTLTLDLGSEKQFSTVGADFLHQLGQWILLPKSVTYATSVNGTDYIPFGTAHYSRGQRCAR